MSLLFPELKMSGKFFEQRRKVEIFIKQAAEEADYRTVYRGDNERAPADALKAPEKRERHYRRDGEAGEVEAGFKAAALCRIFR